VLIFFGILLIIIWDYGIWFLGFGEKFNFVILNPPPGKEKKLSLNSQYIALHYFDHLPISFEGLFKENPWFDDTEFFRRKPKNVYRIFFIGASTTRGFPFIGREISYPSIFSAIIKDVLPYKNIEVINAGYDALSSFGVLDIFNRVLIYEPDLIIVYTGHNEFIGHYGVNSTVNFGSNRWLIRRRLDLQRSSLFLISKLIAIQGRSLLVSKTESKVNLFKLMLRQNRIIWSEQDHIVAENHYRSNLLEMAEVSHKRGVKIIFTKLASNLKHFAPLASVHAPIIGISSKINLVEYISNGKAAFEIGKYDIAIKSFKKALFISPRYAETHFYLGKVYEKKKDFFLARKHFVLAREYDKVHLRGCLKLNFIVSEVAKRYNIPVLDMEQVFDRASIGRISGNNFFFEHVHPNINGQLIMAEAYARFLSNRKIISNSWEWKLAKPAKEYVRMVGFNMKQYINARYTVGRLLLDFPFYQCAKGIFWLREIGKLEDEISLVRTCRKMQKKSLFKQVSD
tara:strand:+ start:206 stop:1738 length:1533 start_codon:yes stop_codon:yes gene_type:complete